MSDLFDKTTDALAISIRMRQMRHGVTASNIANAETPHYHAKKLDFENALASALGEGESIKLNATHEGHFTGPGTSGGISEVSPDIYENPNAAVNNDGNTVDLEKEMSALQENSILYKAALQLINKKMAAVKYALGER